MMDNWGIAGIFLGALSVACLTISKVDVLSVVNKIDIAALIKN